MRRQPIGSAESSEVEINFGVCALCSKHKQLNFKRSYTN